MQDSSVGLLNIKDCEWHTRDPETGEIIFLQNGVLYSQFPQKEKEKIITLKIKTNENTLQKDKNPPKQAEGEREENLTAKFSSSKSGKNIRIFCGGAIATLNSDVGEDYAVVTSIIPKEIVYVEFICPISCSYLGFGISTQSEIQNHSFNKDKFRYFRNSSRRRVTMEINYSKKKIQFYLDGYLNDKFISFENQESYPTICIEKKTTTIILNPYVRYSFVENNKNFLCNNLVFLKNEVKVPIANKSIKEFFNNNIKTSYKPDSVFGEVDSNGLIGGFLILSFFDQQRAEKFKETFSAQSTENKITLASVAEIKEISLKIIEIINLDEIINKYCITKIRKKDSIQATKDYSDEVAQYILKNFEDIQFVDGFSIKSLNSKVNELKNLKLKEINEVDEAKMGQIVQYFPLNDSMLLLQKNKLKIFKRESNGVFDFSSSRFFSASKQKLNLVLSCQDLQYFLENFDFNSFLYYTPSLSTIKEIKELLEAIEEGEKVGEKALISVQDGEKLFLKIERFLNLKAMITREHSQFIFRKERSISNPVNVLQKFSSSNIINETMNKEIDKELPFSISVQEPFEAEEETLNPSEMIQHCSDSYSDLIIKDSLKFTKLKHILTLIMTQISSTNKKGSGVVLAHNLYSAYDNLGTFINYPFSSSQDITQLANHGFYVENSFTNELKYHVYKEKLTNTDSLKTDEKIEKYLNEQFPTTMSNSSLRDYFPLINANYAINAKDYSIEPGEGIEIFMPSQDKPLLVVYSRNGKASIYNYHLGLKKLAEIDIMKGIPKMKDFSQIKEIFWLSSKDHLNTIEDVINFKSVSSGISKNSAKDSGLDNKKEPQYNQEILNNLTSMGFGINACKEAIKLNGDDFTKVLEYLLARGQETEEEPQIQSEAQSQTVKIGQWQCSACTYMNEKGGTICEMCETLIPKEILNEFEKKSQVNGVQNHEEENKEAESVQEFKDFIVRNVHICFNPENDPFAPFILVVVMFNYIETRLTISAYKLMINPLAVKDFINCEENKFYSENITMKKFPSIAYAMKNLNENYFHNIHTLYPLFTDESFHLIPIEHAFTNVFVSGVYDSFAYEYRNEPGKDIKLGVICESDGDIVVMHFDITSEYKCDDFKKDTLLICKDRSFEITSMYDDSGFLTELNILMDEDTTYIISKQNFVIIKDDGSIKKMTLNLPSPICLIHAVTPYFEPTYKKMKYFEIYDDTGKIFKIETDESNSKKIKESLLEENPNEKLDISKIDINSLSEEEMALLPQMLDVERANISLVKSDKDVKGLIKSTSSSPTDYNKVYYNDNINLPKNISLSKESYIILSNIELSFRLKTQIETKKIQGQKLTYNKIQNQPVSKTELEEIDDFIPLTILNFKGAQCQQTKNVSSILFHGPSFVSNYPNPEYIFTNLHENQMIIDHVVVSSNKGPQGGELPFGEGLIFLLNTLENLNQCKEKYQNCTYEAFESIYNDKIKKGEEFYEYDPVSYIRMGTSETIKATVARTKRCKYIYFLPTKERGSNKNCPRQSMSLLFFGVEGKEEKNKDLSILTNGYLDLINNTIGEKKKIDNISLKLTGFKGTENFEIGTHTGIDIEKFITNNETLSQFYTSNVIIKNTSNYDKLFDKVQLSIENKSDIFEVIGVSCDFITYNQPDEKMIQNSSYIMSNFHKMLLNQEEFNQFNHILSSNVFNQSISVSKNISIVKYLSYLYNKLPTQGEKIFIDIDYFNLIKNNILSTSNETLSSVSFDFIKQISYCEKYKNVISTAFESILSNLTEIPLSYTGIEHLIGIIKATTIEGSILFSKLVQLIKKCLTIIKDSKFQTNEQIFLSNFIKLNEYPFDFFNYESSGSNQDSIKNENEKYVGYKALYGISGDSIELIIDLQQNVKIDKIKLLFTPNDSKENNFRVSIFGDDNENNTESFFKLRSFNYYYDYVWKQLTQPPIKDYKITFQTKDYRSLEYNYSKDDNFKTRYLIIMISIKDGTKENKIFPLISIYPLISGEIMSNEVPNDYEKIAKLFITPIIKVTEETVLGNKFISKTGSDKKKIVEYTSNNHIQIANNKSADTLKEQYILNLKNFQTNLSSNIANIMSSKNFDHQKFKNQSFTIIENIKALQTKICNLNVPIKMNDSLSLNIQLIRVFLKECMAIFPSESEKVITVDIIYDLVTVCLINDCNNTLTKAVVYDFIKKIFAGKEVEGNINKLFESINKDYLSKENQHISALNLIDVITHISFAQKLIINELKNSFKECSNWSSENFNIVFYKISVLLTVLRNTMRNNSNDNIELINMCIDFIKQLTSKKDQAISIELNNLILEEVLNLLYDCYVNLDKVNRDKNTNEEIILFLLGILFDLWNTEAVKEKVSNVINILLDPYEVLAHEKVKNESALVEVKEKGYSNSKIILSIQNKTLDFIKSIDQKNESDADKFDYILNLLNKCYSISSYVKKDEASEEKIKSNNSEIIEGFISVAIKFEHSTKIGYCNENNFWKYLTDILERGNLEMMFYNGNFKKLIINSFLCLDKDLQDILYQKFINAFMILYEKNKFVLVHYMMVQILEVVIDIIEKYMNTPNEKPLLHFVQLVLDIVLYGSYETSGKTVIKGIETFFDFSQPDAIEIFKKFYTSVSNFLLLHLNYGSFSGCISNNPKVFQRILAGKNMLILITLYVSEFYSQLPLEIAKSEEMKKSIRNYLIYLIFDKHKSRQGTPPTIFFSSKAWEYVHVIVNLCYNKRELIECCLVEIMKIVRKVDDCIFTGIKNGKIALKKGMKIIKKLFTTLKSLLNKFLIDDTITKYFAFELQGFKFFIDRVISHKQLTMFKEPSASVSEKKEVELNSELLKLITTKEVKEEKKPSSEEQNKKEDSSVYTGNLKKYKKEEFALSGKCTLISNQGNKGVTTVTNTISWSRQKKPTTGSIWNGEINNRNFHEEALMFELPHPIELKEVLISFNMASPPEKVTGFIPSVILECGLSKDKMDICVKLMELKDQQLTEKGNMAFGFNFYSHLPDKLSNDDSYIEGIIDQLINCRARCFRFIVRRPIILSNKTTHISKINSGNINIGLNYLSFNGTKVAETHRVLEFIQEKEKNVSIKIISKIFTAEFIDTLRFIAQDKSTIDNIKQIYNAFEPEINKHATILSNILINVSKYNYELGEWLLNRLLNVDNNEIHAKLAIEITQNSPEYVNDRINKFINFIFNSLSISSQSSIFYSLDFERKINNVGNFIKFFSYTLNGLLISPFGGKLELRFDPENLRNLIFNIQKYSKIRKDILMFITILLLPNEKLKILSDYYKPETSLEILKDLFEKNYIYDYLEITSLLVCNDKNYERIFISSKSVQYYCEMFITEVTSGIRGKNMLYLMNMLKNMSFSKEFVKVVRENNYDFKILESIKNKNEKSASILINNNITFLNDVVVFIRNCISEYPECHKKLAQLLIEDLEICKKKIDKTFAHQVLMSLLRTEKITNVCIHPVDSLLKTIHSSYSNLSEDEEKSKEKRDLKPSLFASQGEKILPGSAVNANTQKVFKKIFDEYVTTKKSLSNVKFQQVFSSVKVPKEKILEELNSKIPSTSPIIIVSYEEKLSTILLLNAPFPHIPNESNKGKAYQTIPYSENLFVQIEDNNYIKGNIKRDIDEISGKEYEFGYITVSNGFTSLKIRDVFLLNLLGSNFQPLYPNIDQLENVVNVSMNSLKINNNIGYEIYAGILPSETVTKPNIISKIIPAKYIDKNGNLNMQLVKQMSYYRNDHPLASTRNNPIFEFPSGLSVRKIKDLIISSEIPFKSLYNNEEVDDIPIDQVPHDKDSNIIDIYYEIPTLRSNTKLLSEIAQKKKCETFISAYVPELPVLKSFEELGGVKKFVAVLNETIKKWSNEQEKEFWGKWILEVEKFSELQSFSSSLIRHQKCFDIIFNILWGVYDVKSSNKEVGIEASKYIYEILDNSFIESKSPELRILVIEKGIFNSVLSRLEALTHEKPRKFNPDEKEDKEEQKEVKTDKPKPKDEEVKKKGIGYGSDHTGDNKTWDISTYLEEKKNLSMLISSIIKLLSDFFDCPDMKLNDKLLNTFLESSILPCLESAYRGGTLLELAKEEQLYYSYLNMTLRLSQNRTFIPLLLDISKDYKPIQTQSVYTLLSILNDVARVFNNCLKSENKEKTTEEKLSKEIMRTFSEVTKNIKSYQMQNNKGKNYLDILKLPVEKSYPLLMKELSFDYMSMRNANGVLEHYYASSISSEATPAKMIRLAQEYADLSRSLPCESTNSIYVRVDKDNMDFMKVLVIGSEGTPYSNGAFEFDVYFDPQYPNGPPKVILITTGGGSVRFNPNLYANGKVCLSLLGTWRGNSSENWDPKISTLLQVLISIQSIIMSDLVYFNEPSCESEMGKPEGEAKNEAYSNIVRYCNIKHAMIDQIRKPSKGFEEVIKRHFYLKREQILKEVKGWIERSKTAKAKYKSYSYDHNSKLATKMEYEGAYTRMMEEIYVELERVLNKLPMPSELEKKTNEEKIALEKKSEKMTFVDIDNVDVTYDDTNNVKKEINLNDDDVKDRWSRYIGAMGMEAVQRQANASILVAGANGVGIEIAKNLVLSGCKQLVLQDFRKTTNYDLSSQFFLTEKDIGINRAEASVKKLQQLNYYVKVQSSTLPLPKTEKELEDFGMKYFNIVILTDCDYSTAVAVDNYCRSRGIYVISIDVYGGFSRIINDFGDKFVVQDKDGEDPKECMVKLITNDNSGTVTVLDGTRHEFVDGDEVVVTEVVGMENKTDKEGINGKKFTVKVLTPATFSLGDLSKYGPYVRNGIIRQIKTPKVLSFKPISECILPKLPPNLADENMSISDYSKMEHAAPIQLGFAALNRYFVEKKFNYGAPWSISTVKAVKDYAQKLDAEVASSAKGLEIISLIALSYQAQFAPLCAYIGGFAAQEAIKAITNKFTPLHQVMYHDVREILPQITFANIDNEITSYVEKNDRTSGLRAILGDKLVDKMTTMKLLMVGAGAIGCELLKNFAMLNIGTEEGGAMYITDPDIIEVSNLTRQFLFREKHLRLPKSATAAAAVIQMNPKLKGHIFAKLDKVCEETENIFTDNFFSSLSLVANALDNVNARRYVDSRCVSSRIPLLESGTLGPKGHVQVIIPLKTESYSSQSDPEVSNDIPQCTLKMFPEEAIHCVEWARDQFGKIFTVLPKSINKVIEDPENVELKLLKKTIKWLKKMPKTFEDCLVLAREKFNKSFDNNIKQLMYSYPIDKKDKNGKLFWSLPKRPPVPDEFIVGDELCADFIAAYGCLMANMFNIKIPYDHPRDKKSKLDMCEKVKNVKVEPFKPNELKAKAIENEVEKEGSQEEAKAKPKGDTEPIDNDDDVEELLKELKKLTDGKSIKLTSTEFEKDNDSNFHIDIIYSMSALRCKNYKLEVMDWMKVKIKAGRIIPALATTTASIAGLQAIELVKIAKQSEISSFRNSFLNLAIPYLQASEPGQVKKVILHEGLSVTLWDRWDIYLDQGKQNIRSLFEILKTKYLLTPRDIFKKKKAVYSYMAYKDKKDLNNEILDKGLKELIGVGNDCEYVDLIITFTKDDKSEEYLKDVPKVRVYFAK